MRRRQGRNLARVVFSLCSAAIILLGALDEFGQDEEVTANMVEGQEDGDGREGIVSHSSDGLEKMMSIIARFIERFGPLVSEPREGDIMCMLAGRVNTCSCMVNAAGVVFNHTGKNCVSRGEDVRRREHVG